MRATSGVFKGLNPTVTVISKILVFAFVIFCALQAERAGQTFEMISSVLLLNLKWFYIGLMTFVVGFLLYLMVSRFGHIRLGRDDEKPGSTADGNRSFAHPFGYELRRHHQCFCIFLSFWLHLLQFYVCGDRKCR